MFTYPSWWPLFRSTLCTPKNLNDGVCYKLRSEQICQNNEGTPQEASAVQLNRQSPNIVRGKNRQTQQATKYCSFWQGAFEHPPSSRIVWRNHTRTNYPHHDLVSPQKIHLPHASLRRDTSFNHRYLWHFNNTLTLTSNVFNCFCQFKCQLINRLSSNLFAKDVSGLDSSATRLTAGAELGSFPFGKLWFIGSGNCNFWTLCKSSFWTLGKFKFRFCSQLIFLLFTEFSVSEKCINTEICLFDSFSLNASARGDGTRASAEKNIILRWGISFVWDENWDEIHFENQTGHRHILSSFSFVSPNML